MRFEYVLSASLVILSVANPAAAGDPRRWVPPPAPPVVEGTPIVPLAEISDGTHFILHLPKPEQVDWRRTRYEVELSRKEGGYFRVTLGTTPFVRDDEVVFMTIPKDSAGKFNIEVIDVASYPHKKVWSGAIDTIKEMAD